MQLMFKFEFNLWPFRTVTIVLIFEIFEFRIWNNIQCFLLFRTTSISNNRNSILNQLKMSYILKKQVLLRGHVKK